MDDHETDDVRYCPRCGTRAYSHHTRGPGDYRVGPCGCLVAHTRYATLPSDRPTAGPDDGSRTPTTPR